METAIVLKSGNSNSGYSARLVDIQPDLVSNERTERRTDLFGVGTTIEGAFGSLSAKAEGQKPVYVKRVTTKTNNKIEPEKKPSRSKNRRGKTKKQRKAQLVKK